MTVSDHTSASRIDAIFAGLARQGRAALMPFVTAGHPSLDATRAVIPALEAAGASMVELGVPFSDPIADGRVIAASMHEALESGVTPEDVLDVIRSVRPGTELGLIVMVSDSIVRRMGGSSFVERAADAGADGLIVPDVDLGDAAELARVAEKRRLSFSLLVAPTTTPERIAAITRCCRGFVYVLARTGLTGEQSSAPEIAARVAAVRAVSDLPIAVGFGIGTAEHVRVVTEVADAAIVGSALVRRMGEAADPVAAARAFVAELARGLSSKSS